MVMHSRIRMDIYPEEIRYNLLSILSRLAPGTKLCAVVKADAYGFGAEGVAPVVEDLVDFYAVSAASEAVQLRLAGITKPILVLGYIWPEDMQQMIRMDVRMTVFREEDAAQISEIAGQLGKKAKIHIKLDTGMNRLGFRPCEESLETICRIGQLDNLEIEGLFTHFAKADEPDLTDALKQYVSFCNFRTALKNRGLDIPICHCANSAASMILPETALDMVRVGIAAYGEKPSTAVEWPVKLHRAMELKSHVTLVKDVPAGEGVSYGFIYVTPKPCRLATVPVGYADGYSRLLSNRAEVLIHGKRAPIRGRICMDQMMVDVTDIPETVMGDEVVLIGRSGDEEITVQELADISGILNYELICGMARSRVPRIYHENERLK